VPSLSLQGAEGYRFDTGPSLLLFPDKYRECFAALGERMEDHLDVVRVRAPSPALALAVLRLQRADVRSRAPRVLQVSPAYRAHFGDGTTFDLTYDMARAFLVPAFCASVLPLLTWHAA
jgi:phytoene desaturase (3,4-didehydrolycopene-forming)